MIKIALIITSTLAICFCAAEVAFLKPPLVTYTPVAELIKDNPAPQKKVTIDQTLRLLVWNIYKQNKKGLVSDLQDLSTKYDFLALQEIHLTQSFHQKIKESPLNQHHIITAPSFNYLGSPTGVSTLSRWHIFNSFFERSPVYEPILNSPKTSLFIDYSISDHKQSLRIGNVHGINFVRHKKFKKHMEQVFQAIRYHQGPLILAGDFNTRNRQRLKLVVRLAEHIGLKLLPLENDQRRTALDLVFVRGLSLKKARLLPNIKTSDHPAIELVFSIPKP